MGVGAATAKRASVAKSRKLGFGCSALLSILVVIAVGLVVASAAVVVRAQPEDVFTEDMRCGRGDEGVLSGGQLARAADTRGTKSGGHECRCLGPPEP